MKSRKQALEAVISLREVDKKGTAALDQVAELSVRGEFRAAPDLASRLENGNGNVPRWIGSLIEKPLDSVPVERSISVSGVRHKAIRRYLKSEGMPDLTEMHGKEVALGIVLTVGTFGSIDLELRRVLKISDDGPWTRWTSDQRELANKNTPHTPQPATGRPSGRLQVDHAPKQIVVIAPQKGSAGRTDVEKELGPDSALPRNVSVTFEDAPFHGRGAENQIARTIAASAKKADLILVARGGGKRSDLWPFETAVVAEAIRTASTQHGAHVVTALGHDRDVTLADEVADSSFPVPHSAARDIKALCWRTVKQAASAKSSPDDRPRVTSVSGEGAGSATDARIAELEKSLTDVELSRDQVQRRLEIVEREHEVAQLNALASTVPAPQHVASVRDVRRSVHLRWVAITACLFAVLWSVATFVWEAIDHFTTWAIVVGLLSLLGIGAEVASQAMRRRAMHDADSGRPANE